MQREGMSVKGAILKNTLDATVVNLINTLHCEITTLWPY